MNNIENILDVIKKSDDFLNSLKEEVEEGEFVQKWRLKVPRFEIVCPISYNDAIFLIRNIETGHLFSPSTNINFLKKLIIEELEKDYNAIK